MSSDYSSESKYFRSKTLQASSAPLSRASYSSDTPSKSRVIGVESGFSFDPPQSVVSSTAYDVHTSRYTEFATYIEDLTRILGSGTIDQTVPILVYGSPSDGDHEIYVCGTLLQWSTAIQKMSQENASIHANLDSYYSRDPIVAAMNEFNNVALINKARVHSYFSKIVCPGFGEANANVLFVMLCEAFDAAFKGFCPMIFSSVMYLRDCVSRTMVHVSLHGLKTWDNLRITKEVVGYNAIRSQFLYSNGKKDACIGFYACDGEPVAIVDNRLTRVDVPGGEIPLNVFPTPPMVVRAVYAFGTEPLHLISSPGSIGLKSEKTKHLPFVLSDVLNMHILSLLLFLDNWETEKYLEESAAIAPYDQLKWIVFNHLPDDSTKETNYHRFILMCLCFQWYADAVLACYHKFHSDPVTSRITAASLYGRVYCDKGHNPNKVGSRFRDIRTPYVALKERR
jgi:hypothetical protein